MMARISFLIALVLAATMPLSFAAKSCKLSYKQLPNMNGYYAVKGSWRRTQGFRNRLSPSLLHAVRLARSQARR